MAYIWKNANVTHLMITDYNGNGLFDMGAIQWVAQAFTVSVDISLTDDDESVIEYGRDFLTIDEDNAA